MGGREGILGVGRSDSKFAILSFLNLPENSARAAAPLRCTTAAIALGLPRDYEFRKFYDGAAECTDCPIRAAQARIIVITLQNYSRSYSASYPYRGE